MIFYKFKNSMKLSIVIITILVISTLSSIVSAMADPNITVSPEKPSPLSNVKFNVIFSDENSISDVRLIAQECTNTLCFPDGFNISMTKKNTNTYESDIKLSRTTATYVKYQIQYNENGEFKISEWKNITLSTSTNGIDNNNNNKSPGFELLLLTLSILFISVLIRKKRF